MIVALIFLKKMITRNYLT